MYCKHCLAANPEGATKCVQCGASLLDAMPGVPPPAGAGELDLQEQVPPAKDAFGPVTTDAVDTGAPVGGPPPLPHDPKKKPEVPPPPMPPDNKMWAIGTIVGGLLGMICICCSCFAGVGSMFGLALGLVALLESGKVKTFYDDKAYDAALAASKRTKTFALIGIGLMVLGLVGGFLIGLVLHGLSFLTNYQSYFNRGQ